MSTLYLIRHGQAGTRDNYDWLSPLGAQQARHLGEYWASQRIELEVVYVGHLRRQQMTAELFCQSLRNAGGSLPILLRDERWSEFSLAAVYQGLREKLCAAEPSFEADYEEMQNILLKDPHATHAAVGRCDRAVIRAWMENRFAEYSDELWDSFQQRVVSSLPDLLNCGRRQIAVFTSATPIAICTGLALGLSNEKVLDLMGVLYNTGLTVFKLRENGLRLISFNTTPHLVDPELRTFR